MPRIGLISSSRSNGLFTWSWLADLWAQAGSPCGLGHALDLNAIQGGNAKTDTIEAQNIAVLRRGGLLPQAYVYPAERRASRDLLRRRMHVMRKRAERLPQVQNTHSQDNRPAMGRKIASTTHRDGVAERFAEPAGQKRIEVALALMGHADARLRDVERSIRKAAKQRNRHTLYLLRTGPGIGESLSLVLL